MMDRKDDDKYVTAAVIQVAVNAGRSPLWCAWCGRPLHPSGYAVCFMERDMKRPEQRTVTEMLCVTCSPIAVHFPPSS
jgi:hypothetical protein